MRSAIGIILVIAAGALTGCVQATRHSNTMVFGTNTSFGIAVGTDATSTPSVTVGYKRQEAVVLPLLANTEAAGELLNPCKPKASGDLPDGCVFVGTGEGNDTYSVLASFGADYKGTSKTGELEAGGQIAQYFATGLAARTLAQRGGAAAVSTGDAAKGSALSSPAMAKRITAVDLASANLRTQAALTAISGKIAAAGANYRGLLASMDQKVGLGGSDFVSACPVADTAANCGARLVTGAGLGVMTVAELELAAAVS